MKQQNGDHIKIFFIGELGKQFFLTMPYTGDIFGSHCAVAEVSSLLGCYNVLTKFGGMQCLHFQCDALISK